jgi:hypothetical protein
MNCQQRWPCCCSKSLLCTDCGEGTDPAQYEYAILCRFRVYVNKQLRYDEATSKYQYYTPAYIDNAQNILSLKLNDVPLTIPDMILRNDQIITYDPYYYDVASHCVWGLYYTDEKIMVPLESMMSCKCFRSFFTDFSLTSLGNLNNDLYRSVNGDFSLLNTYDYHDYSFEYGFIQNSDIKNANSGVDYSYLAPRRKFLAEEKLKRYKISKEIFVPENNILDVRFSSLPFEVILPNGPNYYTSLNYYSPSYPEGTISKQAKVNVDYIVVRFRDAFPECIPNKSMVSARVANTIQNDQSSYPYDSTGENYSWYFSNNYIYDDWNYYNSTYYNNYSYGTYYGGWGRGNIIDMLRIYSQEKYFGVGGRSFFDVCKREKLWEPICGSGLPENLVVTIESQCVQNTSIVMGKATQRFFDNESFNYFDGSGVPDYSYYGKEISQTNTSTITTEVYMEPTVYGPSRKRAVPKYTTSFYGDFYIFDLNYPQCLMPKGFVDGIYRVLENKSGTYSSVYEDLGPAPSGRVTGGQPYQSGEAILGYYYRYITASGEVYPDYLVDSSGRNLQNIGLEVGGPAFFNRMYGFYGNGYYWWAGTTPGESLFNNTNVIEQGAFRFHDKSLNVPYYDWPSSGTAPLVKDEGIVCSPMVFDSSSAISVGIKPIYVGYSIDRIEMSTSGSYTQYIPVSGNYILASIYEDKVFGSPHYWSLFGKSCEASGLSYRYKGVTVTS